MSRVYVPGAPRTARDRTAAAGHALRRRKRGLQAAVARFVARRTTRQLEGAPIGPIFLWALPFALKARFRPDATVDFDGSDIDATILLNILRDAGRRRDQFEIAISGRRCRVRRHRGDGRRPDGTLTVALADVIRLSMAAVDTFTLLAESRAVVTGDAFLVARFPGMFRQPTRSLV